MIRFLKEYYSTKDLYVCLDNDEAGENTLIAVFFKTDISPSEANLETLLDLIHYNKIKNNSDLQVIATELNLNEVWIDKYENLLSLKHNVNISCEKYMDFRMIVDNIMATSHYKCDNNKQIRYLMQHKITHELYFINKEDYDIHKLYSNLLNSFYVGDSETNLRKVYLMVTHYANDIKDITDLKVLQRELSFNNEMLNHFNKLLELKQEYHLQNELYIKTRNIAIKSIANEIEKRGN